MNRLSTGQVEDFVLELRGTRSASTVRQVHLLLVVLLDAAVKHELLRRNVARGVDRPQRERRDLLSPVDGTPLSVQVNNDPASGPEWRQQ